jgi:hypothetical protein
VLFLLSAVRKFFFFTTTVFYGIVMTGNNGLALPIKLGWQELVHVLPGDPKIEATLDTSIETSSLYVASYRKLSLPETTLESKSTAQAEQLKTNAQDFTTGTTSIPSTISSSNAPLTATPTISNQILTKTLPALSNLDAQASRPFHHSKKSTKEPEKVRFELSDRFGHHHTYEVPILRVLNIKLSSGKTQLRPVIPIKLCLGSIIVDSEVSLRRSKITQNPLRLGRGDLAGKILVDPSKSFTSEPVCKTTS